MTVQDSLALIIEQLQIVAIFLARPSVQRQVVVIGVILLVAWALPILALGRLQRRLPAETDAEPARGSWQRRTEAFYLILAPLLALLLVQVALVVFTGPTRAPVGPPRRTLQVKSRSQVSAPAAHTSTAASEVPCVARKVCPHRPP